MSAALEEHDGKFCIIGRHITSLRFAIKRLTGGSMVPSKLPVPGRPTNLD